MKITIEIELDNAAFSNDDHFYAGELGRILARIPTELDGRFISELEEKGDNGNLRDYNGNNVGQWVLE